MSQTRRLATFSEFYPFSLSEHTNRTCRRLHFFGTTIALSCFVQAGLAGRAWLVPFGVVVGYLLAWIGHRFYEKNRPTTFTHPFFSFVGRWTMWGDVLARRIKF